MSVAQPDLTQKNNKLIKKLLLLAVSMFAFGYVLVPLYDVFCDITGLNGKTSSTALAEKGYEVDFSREIKVEFLTMINNAAEMEFKAEKINLTVHPGEYHTVNFLAKNISGKPMVARAIPSVSPGLAAEFFEKTECFCFSEQQFAVGEEKRMPVRFVINPELEDRYKTVTLAYTFFDITANSITKP